jgi:hypothetical protein
MFAACVGDFLPEKSSGWIYFRPAIVSAAYNLPAEKMPPPLAPPEAFGDGY